MIERARNERPAPTPPRRRRWLWLAIVVPAILGALVVAIALFGYAFLASDTGLALAIRELELRSGGRLSIEGASGSIFSEIHVKRLTWRGSASDVVATDAVLTWHPTALWSRGVVVQTLGAQRIELRIEPSTTDVPPPSSLALPFGVTIEHLAVTELHWQVGPNGGLIRGIALSYEGGARTHRVTELELGTEDWKLSGDATMDAVTPFALNGALVVTGTDPQSDARAELALSGTLPKLAVDGRGTAHRARFTARAALAPLAVVPLTDLALDASYVDLAAWSAGLPTTRLGVVARTQQTREGLAGTVEATNTLPGAIDTSRVPLRSLAAQFNWDGGAIDLEALNAEIVGGGRARGRGRIALGAAAGGSHWSLDVADIDLHALYTPLVTTRLGGTIAADLDHERQKLRGDVTERVYAAGIALRFAATVDAQTLVIESVRARAGDGELVGRARIGRDEARPYTLEASVRRFDPARFGSFPAGALDGRITARGVLVPDWRVEADVAIDKGSRLAAVELAGTVRATVEQNAIRDADIALTAGSAKLTAKGNAGRADDVLTATLDAPKLADLMPLAGASPPRLAGALSARARWHGALRGGGFDVTAKGSNLKLGEELALGALELDFAVAAITSRTGASDLAARGLRLDARGSDFVGPQGRFKSARAKLDGTIARHELALALTSADVTLDAAAHGGFTSFDVSAPPSQWRWAGTIDRFTGTGPLAVRLDSPMTVALARERIQLGEARIAVADGTMHLAEFTWEEGRITSRGALTAVPLATVARVAGVTLPFDSTLTLGGEWSIAATPRLTGTASVRREGGDVRIRGDPAANIPGAALGVTTLEVNARFANDAVDGSGTFASARGGKATAKLTIGAAPGAPPGRITASAPISLEANAELATLHLLQPWIGTTAVVDGRARADIEITGTLGRMQPAGTLAAEALRIDAPQYGVFYRDGRFRAHFADRGVALDELVLHAGEGEFRASGTLSGVTTIDGRTTAAIGWQASRFRLFNRPDMNLVVDGEGKLGFTQGKLALEGKLRAREGRIIYAVEPTGTLGDDVVVKGWTKPEPSPLRAADVPLVVDLALDFGEQLTFSGEGLETGVAGTVRVTNGARGFVGKGSLITVNGTYRAFGQKLTIDRGRLIFDGPLDNPGLDFVALRKNLAVEAGVIVSGTVRVPIIQLTSNPPVPDAEKLSWLVLGHGLERTSGSDLATLQAASALLMGRNGKSITSSIAERVGLDDISFKETPTSAARNGPTTDAQGRVIALGKRLSDKLMLVYEQGLTVATSAVKLEYALTRDLTVRVETGVVSGFGIQYHRTFE